MEKAPRFPRLTVHPESEHPFYELGARRFEQFARALHQAEPSITGTSLYAPDGQEQFGIDHFAYGHDQEGAFLEVGQAKAERSFGRAEIRAAADKFMGFWEDQWHDKKIRRFILFVGCAVKSRLAHDEVIAQITRFAKVGVTFELWDSAQIYDRLHGAPTAVRTYLGHDWYERVFGKPVGLLSELQQDLESGWNMGALRVQAIVQRLNQAESAEVAELRRRVRRGESQQVSQELDYALQSEAAAALAPSTKAEKLRLLAGLVLAAGQASRARRLLDEADALSGDSARLRAVLLLETSGPDALLASLDGHLSPELAEVQAVALLRKGRPAQALQALEPFTNDPTVRAEALRLTAFAKLLSGDREAAVDLAERACQRDPDAQACQHALGVCLFHRALSPAALVDVGEWPQPIEQPLVGEADDARADLERAEAIFRGLTLDPRLDGHVSAVMWHFGALVCMPWRYREALARLSELQGAGKMPVPMIAWAISRALPFDHDAAAAQCDTNLAANPKDFDTLLIRVAMANADGETALARSLLENHREVLEAAGHGALFAYWSTVLDLEARKEPPAAVLQSHPWLELRRAMDLRPRKKRLQAINDVLAGQLRAEGDPRVILAAAQMLLDAGWYRSAVKAAGFLVDRIGTAEAIGAAAFAYYRSGRPAEVLSVLERVDAFPNAQLPVALERLKAGALGATGELREARDVSVAVARATRHARDIWQSIHLQLAIGATKEALTLYEEHAELLSAPDPGHIALARAVLQTDPEAARRITSRIAAIAPDNFVTAAFELANKLRMDSEQRALMGRMQALGAAGKGGVTLVTVDDVVAMMKERREQAERAFETFANGHAPVYIFSAFHPGLLPATYLAPLLDPPQPQDARPLVSARYGRRLEEDPWPERRQDIRLVADVTALLTGQGLGILDTIERSFAPIRIAPDAINALLAMRVDLEVVQPDRLDAARRVWQLILSGRISDQSSLSPVDTYTVLWEGDGGEPSSTLSFARLFEILSSGLAPDRERQARELLGSTLEASPAGARPPRGAVLILSPGIALQLETAGLLDAAVRTFLVGLDRDEIVELEAEVVEADRRRKEIDALNALIGRLNTGLEEGVYLTVARTKDRDPDPARRAFMQVLGAMRDGSSIAWVDDRFTSAIDNPRFQIATSVEMIDALVKHERLSPAEQRGLRQRLRAARWLFMPQRSDEIVYYLREATRGGDVCETAHLALLRRAAGNSLHHRRRLQWPDAKAFEQGVKGEVPFLLDSGHAITEALVAIWRDESWTTDDAAAASDWLLGVLEINLFPLPVLAAGDPRSDYLLGVHAASLVLSALQIFNAHGYEERQSAFLDWLWRNHLATMLRVRPEIRAGLIEIMASNLAEDDKETRKDRVWRAFSGRTINLMPLPLRTWLLQREDMRRTYRLPDYGLITVEQEDFDELTFLKAVITAERGKANRIKSMAGTSAAVRLAGDKARPHLQFTIGGRGLRLDDWVRRVASSDPHIRARALEERSDVLDMSEVARAALNDTLGALTDPIERARLAMAKAAATQQRSYDDLEKMAQELRPFALADLAPDDPLKVVRHLRLEADIANATDQLIGDRGLAVAARRVGGLPIAPPANLRAAVAELNGDDLKAFIDSVGAETAPPWVQLFLADLLLDLTLPPLLLAQVRGWIEQSLSTAAAPLWELYIALAEFAGSEATAHENWSGLTAFQQLSLCWSHANSLAEILANGRVRVDKLVESLRDHRLVSPRVLVETRTKFELDVGNPAKMAPDRLRVHLAASALLKVRALENHAEWADATLRALLIQDGDGEPIARFEIARGALAPDDAMSSRLGEPLGQRIDFVLPGARRLFRDGLPDLLGDMLAETPESENSRSAWLWLRLASADTPLPADLSQRAIQRASTVDLGFDVQDLREARTNLLTLTALASVNGWTELQPAIDAAMAKLGPRDQDEDAQFLLEIALWRAKLEAEPLARCRKFAQAIAEVGHHPHLREQAEIAARHFARALSGQQTEPFVDALAALLISY